MNRRKPLYIVKHLKIHTFFTALNELCDTEKNLKSKMNNFY